MKVIENKGQFQLNLDRGEKLMSSLTSFVREYNVQGGQLTGIGAIENVKLGVYHLNTKSYEVKEFGDGIYELISFVGNISEKEGLPFIHAHIAMGDHKFNTISGHLMECDVALVCEIFCSPLGKMPMRVMNDSIGLAAINHGKN